MLDYLRRWHLKDINEKNHGLFNHGPYKSQICVKWVCVLLFQEIGLAITFTWQNEPSYIEAAFYLGTFLLWLFLIGPIAKNSPLDIINQHFKRVIKPFGQNIPFFEALPLTEKPHNYKAPFYTQKNPNFPLL